MRAFRPKPKVAKKRPPKPSWSYRLSPIPPQTPQELASIVVANDPETFATVKALTEAMREINDRHHLGFRAGDIGEAARVLVRSDARGLSPAYELIAPTDDLDPDLAAQAWSALGSRFGDPDHAISTIKTWMANVRQRLLHEPAEPQPVPLIVGDTLSRQGLIEPLLQPLYGHVRHVRGADLAPSTILADDGLGTIPIAVVEIDDQQIGLDRLSYLASSQTITLPGLRSVIRVPIETSILASSNIEVAGCNALVLTGPQTTKLRIDHKLLWLSATA